jgi:hypothetical protein
VVFQLAVQCFHGVVLPVCGRVQKRGECFDVAFGSWYRWLFNFDGTAASSFLFSKVRGAECPE